MSQKCVYLFEHTIPGCPDIIVDAIYGTREEAEQWADTRVSQQGGSCVVHEKTQDRLRHMQWTEYEYTAA
jgi:hypothetical protein